MRQRLLAANNLVMGTANILLIAVPDTWRVADGYATPEVDRWSEFRERRWMMDGHAPYRLVEPHPEADGVVRAEVELLIQAVPLKSPAVRPRLASVAEVQQVELSGHQAEVTFGTVRRGLFPPRTVPALHIGMACPATGRRLTLDLNAALRGSSPAATEEDLAALLEALKAGLGCH